MSSTQDQFADLVVDTLSFLAVVAAAIVLWYIAWRFFFSRIPLVSRLVGFISTEYRNYKNKKAAASAASTNNNIKLEKKTGDDASSQQQQQNNLQTDVNSGGGAASPTTSTSTSTATKTSSINGRSFDAPRTVFGMKPRKSQPQSPSPV